MRRTTDDRDAGASERAARSQRVTNMRRIDATPVIDLVAEPGTGPVRARRPVYEDLLPPCNNACPAGENVQEWLALAQSGRFHEAWLALVRDNPLPAVHGRVCYHPCEGACNRQQLDSSVSIHAVERFLGDMAAHEGWEYPAAAPASGQRILVVGTGPSGLSAAYHLARLGHSIEMCESEVAAGGMMRFGIPAYRLPREVLAREIARIEAMGVRIRLGHRVEHLLEEKVAGAFDAVFVAVGAHISKRVEIPARDAARVLDAVSYLHRVGAGERPRLGRRVLVYGGGNTAMDAARTARRLGAEDTLIVYRRDREHMSAHAFEAEEATEEGITIRWLTSIRKIAGPRLTVETMELDANGAPQPTGNFEELDADAVVLALGQQTDATLLAGIPGIKLRPDGTAAVDEAMMTGHPGIFAGGDMVPGERTVTAAVGHGKRAARRIDAWLRGGSHAPELARALVSFDMLHLPIYTDAERTDQPALTPRERVGGFAEIRRGLDEHEARREAQRCLSCGNCFECDQCFAACPEVAIEKLGRGKRYRFVYERCTGCAVCFETCPVHAISLIAEPAGGGIR